MRKLIGEIIGLIFLIVNPLDNIILGGVPFLTQHLRIKKAIQVARLQAGLVELRKKNVKTTLNETVYADQVLRKKYGNNYMHHLGVKIGKLVVPPDVFEIVGNDKDGREKAIILSQSYEDENNFKIIGIVDIKTDEVFIHEE
jgi:hypothetical protein